MTTQLLTGHLIINQYNQNYTGQFRFQKVIPTMPVFLKCLESNQATNRKAFEKKKSFQYQSNKATCLWIYGKIQTSQSTIRCSKLTIETVEQGVKYVQS